VLGVGQQRERDPVLLRELRLALLVEMLTPSTTAFDFLRPGSAAWNSQVSCVQPGVSSFG
jgi:hypothetical protein